MYAGLFGVLPAKFPHKERGKKLRIGREKWGRSEKRKKDQKSEGKNSKGEKRNWKWVAQENQHRGTKTNDFVQRRSSKQSSF